MYYEKTTVTGSHMLVIHTPATTVATPHCTPGKRAIHTATVATRDGNGCDLSVYLHKKFVGHDFGYESVPMDTDTGNT